MEKTAKPAKKLYGQGVILLRGPPPLSWPWVPGARRLIRCTIISPGAGSLAPEGAPFGPCRRYRSLKILDVLEYACGMATHANGMLQDAHSVNRNCEILVTRKSFPFAKRFTMRALLIGGVMPHRLGLSESVLIFENHRALYDDTAAFEAALPQIKKRCVEKKLVIESESLEDAKRMLQLGADVIQMDKSVPETLAALVAYKREHHPHAAIIAAGGINRKNVVQYAQTGVDAIVTSSLYQAGMADLTTIWKGV